MLLLLLACAANTEPTAAVYRGPGGCNGCSAAVAALLQAYNPPFTVVFTGPDDEPLADALATASVYAQPGGVGSLKSAWDHLESSTTAIQAFVDGGGNYLGFCMGGYLAGSDPGFDLLPGNSDQYIALDDADVADEADTIVPVVWGDESRDLYFQDGPYFLLDPDATVDVLATYAANGEIAALVTSYGSGHVGVVGPHPEATQDWYDVEGLTDPDGLDTDLGLALVAAVVE